MNYENLILDNTSIARRQETLAKNEVISYVQNVDDLRTFMQHHAYVILDMMVLVKKLNGHFITSTIQETDIFTFHQSLLNIFNYLASYLKAMQEVGANTYSIEKIFDLTTKKTANFQEIFTKISAKKFIVEYAAHTLEVANNNSISELLSIFLYGCENALPLAFRNMICHWGFNKKKAPTAFYFFENHSSIFNDHLIKFCAEKIITHEIKNDLEKWHKIRNAISFSINARMLFWNGVANSMKDEAYQRILLSA